MLWASMNEQDNLKGQANFLLLQRIDHVLSASLLSSSSATTTAAKYVKRKAAHATHATKRMTAHATKQMTKDVLEFYLKLTNIVYNVLG